MIPNKQLTKNFFLHEFLKSQTAERNPAIKEKQYSPSETILLNIQTVANSLQLIRNFWKLPMHITSGYRCPELNKAIGGSNTSAHTWGGAVDFEPLLKTGEEAGGEEYLKIAGWIIKNMVWDQLIFEYGTIECASWLHLGKIPPDKYPKERKQFLCIGNYTQGKYRNCRIENGRLIII